MNQRQQISNNEEAENFFRVNQVDIESVQPDADKKSKVEQDFLFSGGLTDIEVWIKHEEQRLKLLEFKLKKKTLITETRSTYKDRKNERKLRKENAKKAFKFSAIWACFIACFILMHGINKIKLPFFNSFLEIDFIISETEFIFVCGSLTTSVLIFYLTVIKNLFPNKPDIKRTFNQRDED